MVKRYPGQADPAIDKLSLKVPAGEICVLVGPSGCGKTTALRLVNRMIELSEGDILIDGVSIRTRSPAELRRQIGYVIQQIGLFPHLTIGSNIATVPKLLGWSREKSSSGSSSCWTWCRSRPISRTAIRRSSREDSASASASRERLPPIHR